MLLTSFLMLIAGLTLLVFAGDYLVRGAVGLAENLGIPPLIIGLTIVALGTSLPELFVSVQAAFNGVPGLAIGNVVGSNIANILLVLGLPAMILAVSTDEDGVSRSTLFMVLLSIVTAVLFMDGVVSRLEGCILLLALTGFLVAQVLRAKAHQDDMDLETLEAEVGEPPHDAWRIALYIIGGIAALPVAAHLTVEGASDIARTFGVSDAAIGLTIVAIGTSLPELAAGVMAAIRGSSQVAIGNVVGSNIFNIAGIMGVTAVIIPLDVADGILSRDAVVMIVTALLLLVFAWRKWPIKRVAGGVMLAAYAAYIISVF